jgi:membrane-bound lytic murein transglycosylase A
MRRLPAALAALAVLAGCSRSVPPPLPASAPAGTPAWNVPTGPGPAMTPVGFDHLPGWSQDRVSEAMPGFLADCTQMLANPAVPLGGSLEAGLRGGTGEQWRRACNAAQLVPAHDDAAARTFFEANFQPFGLSSDGSAKGLFTGYYEPELRGARKPSKVYDVPLYRRPPGLRPGGRRYLSRTQIENGALRRKRLELLWVDDPIDAFFLQIQGAGRIVLPDGDVARVTYDGQNGQPYVPIGRVLVDRGVMTLDQVSMQSVRDWLRANPRQARGVMNQNPSYVFFRELPGLAPDQGPPGAFTVRLAPMRSLAVDKTFIPMGAPVFIDTTDPLDGTKMQRLMMAQDLGGAIRGPVRADILFGWGPAAEERAGRMRGQGTEYVLLPK